MQYKPRELREKYPNSLLLDKKGNRLGIPSPQVAYSLVGIGAWYQFQSRKQKKTAQVLLNKRDQASLSSKHNT